MYLRFVERRPQLPSDVRGTRVGPTQQRRRWRTARIDADQAVPKSRDSDELNLIGIDQ